MQLLITIEILSPCTYTKGDKKKKVHKKKQLPVLHINQTTNKNFKSNINK